MRNTVRFQTDAFNTTEARPYFLNPGCYGDDVGHWLKMKLQDLGYYVEGPEQEDGGWYLICRDGATTHSLCIGHTGEEWQITLQRHRSLGEWLVRKPKTPAPVLARRLHRMLLVAPEVKIGAWLMLDERGREIDSGREP